MQLRSLISKLIPKINIKKKVENNVNITSIQVEDIFDICVKEEYTFGGEKPDKVNFIKPAEISLLGKNRGLCSTVYSIKFFTSNHTSSLVTKIPTIIHLTEPYQDLPENERSQKKKETFEKVSELHTNELAFYSLLKESKITDLKVPKFIFGREMTENQDGLILMEDFSNEDLKNTEEKYEGLQYLDEKQIKEAIVEIAKLQAIGFILPNARQKLGKLKTAMSDLTTIHETTLDQLKQLKFDFVTQKRLKQLTENCQKKIFENHCFSNRQVNLPTVLCHNDFWTKNIIFSPNSGRLLSIIDWQTAKFASPTHDLAALLALELPGEIRRKEQKDYIDFYLNQLFHYLDHYEIKNDDGLRKAKIDDLMIAYKDSLKVAIYGVIFTLTKYDEQFDGNKEAKESPLVQRVHLLLEDLYP